MKLKSLSVGTAFFSGFLFNHLYTIVKFVTNGFTNFQILHNNKEVYGLIILLLTMLTATVGFMCADSNRDWEKNHGPK